MGKIPIELKQVVAHNIRTCRMKTYPGRGGATKCAKAFGVSPQQWSPWERAIRTPDESCLSRIARFFNVTDEWMKQDHRPPEITQNSTPTNPAPLQLSLPPIEGIDVPPPPSWQPSAPGSAESFFWLARHFIAVIQTKGVQIDKNCLEFLAGLVKK